MKYLYSQVCHLTHAIWSLSFRYPFAFNRRFGQRDTVGGFRPYGQIIRRGRVDFARRGLDHFVHLLRSNGLLSQLTGKGKVMKLWIGILFYLTWSTSALALTLTLKNNCHCEGATLFCDVSLVGDHQEVFRPARQINLDRGSDFECAAYRDRTHFFNDVVFAIEEPHTSRDSWDLAVHLDREYHCYAYSGSMACDLVLAGFLMIDTQKGYKGSPVVAYNGVYVPGASPDITNAEAVAAYGALGSHSGIYGTITLSQKVLRFYKTTAAVK